MYQSVKDLQVPKYRRYTNDHLREVCNLFHYLCAQNKIDNSSLKLINS